MSASQNQSKSVQYVPKSMFQKNTRFSMDLCWFLVASCKRPTSNFMRPANVLLTFHIIQLLAFSTYFASDKPTKNPSKTRPKPLKNWCWKCAIFYHRIFRVGASILEPLGAPSWNQVGHFGLQKLWWAPSWAILSWMSCKNDVLVGSGLDFKGPGPRFRKAQERFFEVLAILNGKCGGPPVIPLGGLSLNTIHACPNTCAHDSCPHFWGRMGSDLISHDLIWFPTIGSDFP